MTEPQPAISLSIIAPAHNERDNVAQLVAQVFAAAAKTGAVTEFIIVDDCSTDDTAAQVRSLMAQYPGLRLLQLQREPTTPQGKGNGQSAAFYAGIRAARGEWIGMLDADLQNDPAEFVTMYEQLRGGQYDLVQGDRSAARKDNLIRRASSRVGRIFRRIILADVVRDTGCSLRVVSAHYARQLPLQFRGMHRFIPISCALLGARILQVAVHHRPRTAGTTKYGMGITQRAIPGLIDCLAVRWMASRRRTARAVEQPSRASAL